MKTNRISRTMGAARMWLLAAAGIAAAAGAPLVFEVASIKPSDPNAANSLLNFVPGGGLKVVNGNLKQLISFAYDVREFQISGGPGWIDSARYDILAKPERSEGPADLAKLPDLERGSQIRELRERLQSLLADRFQLSIHKETKQVPVYGLLVGKNGPKLEESKAQDAANIGIRRHSENGKHTLIAKRTPMVLFVTGLSGMLGRPVIDQTGLKAEYDFQMEWSQDQGVRTPDSNSEDGSGPSIFTAIQQQLGLRLDSQKGPVEIVVIDRVEKPSEN